MPVDPVDRFLSDVEREISEIIGALVSLRERVDGYRLDLKTSGDPSRLSGPEDAEDAANGASAIGNPDEGGQPIGREPSSEKGQR